MKRTFGFVARTGSRCYAGAIMVAHSVAAEICESRWTNTRNARQSHKGSPRSYERLGCSLKSDNSQANSSFLTQASAKSHELKPTEKMMLQEANENWGGSETVLIVKIDLDYTLRRAKYTASAKIIYFISLLLNSHGFMAVSQKCVHRKSSYSRHFHIGPSIYCIQYSCPYHRLKAVSRILW